MTNKIPTIPDDGHEGSLLKGLAISLPIALACWALLISAIIWLG